jgi:hypothetical protein
MPLGKWKIALKTNDYVHFIHLRSERYKTLDLEFLLSFRVSSFKLVVRVRQTKLARDSRRVKAGGLPFRETMMAYIDAPIVKAFYAIPG